MISLCYISKLTAMVTANHIHIWKNQKQLYFNHMGSAPCAADFIEIWFDSRDCRHNHLCQIL